MTETKRIIKFQRDQEIAAAKRVTQSLINSLSNLLEGFDEIEAQDGSERINALTNIDDGDFAARAGRIDGRIGRIVALNQVLAVRDEDLTPEVTPERAKFYAEYSDGNCSVIEANGEVKARDAAEEFARAFQKRVTRLRRATQEDLDGFGGAVYVVDEPTDSDEEERQAAAVEAEERRIASLDTETGVV